MKKEKREKALKLIREYSLKGYSSNKIQKELQRRKLGMRRTILLREIRLAKKRPRQQVLVPVKRIEKPITIYRVSYIIPSIPFHSRPFKRCYLGFRLIAFSSDRDLLLNRDSVFRNLLIRLSSEYVKSNIMEWNKWDVVIGKERPIQVSVSEHLNGTWQFAVEQEGIEQYSRSGNL